MTRPDPSPPRALSPQEEAARPDTDLQAGAVPRGPEGVELRRRDLGVAHDADTPLDYRPRDWRAIAGRIWTALTDNALWIHCGCVGFFGFLSIFPILGLFVAVYGLAFDPSDIEGQLAGLRPLVPGDVYALVVERLAALTANSAQDLSLGIAITLGIGMWTGSRGVNAVIDLLNLSYHEPQPRSFVKRALFAIAATFAALAGITVVLIAVAALPLAVARLPLSQGVETLVLWGRWPLLAAFIFCGLILLFRHAPNRRPAKVRWVAPGATVSTLLWLLLSVGFSAYVEWFDAYGDTFGALAVAAVLMLWIYYSALTLAVGAIVNAEIELQTRRDSTRGAPRPRGKRGAVVADRLPGEVGD